MSAEVVVSAVAVSSFAFAGSAVSAGASTTVAVGLLTALRSKALFVKRADLPERSRRKLRFLRRTLARRVISIFSTNGL